MKRKATASIVLVIAALTDMSVAAQRHRANNAFVSAPVQTITLAGAAAPGGASIVCDGITDATETINAALVAQRGAALVLPAGICRISASLNVPAQTSLEGRGRHITIIKTPPDPGFAAITLSGSWSHVAHLSVNGNSSAAGTRGGDGIRLLYAAKDASVFDIEVYGTADNGIEINSENNANIYSNYIHNNYTNGIYSYGTNTERVSHANIIRNHVYFNSYKTTKWDGIDLDSATDNSTISSNYVTGNDIILFDSAVGTGSSFRNLITMNVINRSNENCINISGNEHDISIFKNTCTETTGYGILINANTPAGDQNLHDIIINRNKIIGASRDGIWAGSLSGAAGPHDLDIRGNRIENVSRSALNTMSAITLKNGTDRWTITGNTLSPGKGRYAIDASSAAGGQAWNNSLTAGQSGETSPMQTSLATRP